MNIKIMYSVTIFFGALLLFSVQPMIAKMILPQLGGTPAIWQTVMLFFQLLLLVGYGYVHVTTTKMTLKHQIITHRLILITAFIFLPFSLHNGTLFDRNIYPVLWLFETLIYSVSIPFFILSTTAPILQKWFSLTKSPDSHNPYLLYSASNAGSLIALISYPFVVEPLLTLHNQTFVWSVLFVIFAAIVLYISTKIDNNAVITDNAKHSNTITPPTWTEKLTWCALSFIPSSLMLGVTTYITTDVGAIPLLWIIPFALYLLSFILVFSQNMIGYQFFKKLFPLVIAITIGMVFYSDGEFGDFDFLRTVLFLTISFLWIAIRYHGELVERRPQAENLTYFYLYMSIGGALGGFFNAIIAPVIFSSAWEYHIILVLSALIVLQRFRFFKILFFIIVSTIITIVIMLSNIKNSISELTTRNFFGVSRVHYDNDGKSRTYSHGTTNHGMQSTIEWYRLKPQTYYSGANDFINLLPDDIKQKPMAITGLGVGTLTCFAQHNQKVDIYEIDPMVVKIANDSRFFTYMRDCKGDKKVILGDARLKLQEATSKKYGIMFMDAYSSDSLPIHLLTKEAMAMYLDKIDDNGIIAFHITNRHLNLKPILAQFANDFKLSAYSVEYDDESDNNLYIYNEWVLLSKNQNILNKYQGHGLWQPLDMTQKILWTDNYSSIFSILK